MLTSICTITPIPTRTFSEDGVEEMAKPGKHVTVIMQVSGIGRRSYR